MYNKVFKSLSSLLLVVALTLTFCSCNNEDVYDLSESVDGAEKVQYRDLGYNIPLSGVISGNDETSIYSTLNAVVSEVVVKKGDKVKKGDVICKFDTKDIQSRIDNLESGVTNQDSVDLLNKQKAETNLANAKSIRNLMISQAKSALDEANSNYNNACDNYNTYLALYNEKIAEANSYAQNTPDETGENSSYQVAMAEATEYLNMYTEYYNSLPDLKKAISDAEYGYNQTVLEQDSLVAEAQYAVDQYKNSSDSENKANLSKLKKELENYTVYASCDGVVSELNIQQGALYQGEGLPVAKIAKEKGYEVVAYVPEKDIISVKTGMEVNISVTGTSDFNTTGVIEEVSLVKDTENSGFRVVIGIEDSKSLKLGMSVQANIFVKEVENTLSVGYRAVKEDHECGYYVYRLKALADKEGVYELEKVPVEVTLSHYEHTQINSGNLSEGDMVISDPTAYIEGALVTLGDREVK